MYRINIRHLRSKLRALNDLVGYPADGLDPTSNKPVPGAFVLDKNIGGYQLCQYTNEQGGERDLTPRGTAREILDQMEAYWRGYYDARQRFNQEA